jgi:hypothetical protein
MSKNLVAALCGVCVCAAVLTGCARSARSTAGFALVESASVDAPLPQAWQATKDALLELDFEVYTRDKRGYFEAYSDQSRTWLTPARVKHVIVLEEQSPERTRVAIESVRQVYGVTLLTYPGWHDRKTDDNALAVELLDAIKNRLTS